MVFGSGVVEIAAMRVTGVIDQVQNFLVISDDLRLDGSGWQPRCSDLSVSTGVRAGGHRERP
ncbi:MAG: hypothetical protein HYX27_04450 [Acidobacteria bacterium]|nr:hypothetical protein [Acidobacteriota bacterium]